VIYVVGKTQIELKNARSNFIENYMVLTYQIVI
jgi:hypothetical protein